MKKVVLAVLVISLLSIASLWQGNVLKFSAPVDFSRLKALMPQSWERSWNAANTSDQEHGAGEEDPSAVLKELVELTAQQRGDINCTGPLIPIYDQVISPTVARQQKQTQRSIPRIFHVSMKSRCVPQDLARGLQRWYRILPDHSIFFHDDDAVDRLLRQAWPEFPNLHKILQCVLQEAGAMKIDIWRILVLYRYGGIYSDIDVWPRKPFRIDDHIHPDLSGFFLSDTWNRPTQWFMAMEPKHPMANFTMHQIIQNVLDLPDIYHPKLVFVTGPHVLKGGYSQFLSNQEGQFREEAGKFTGTGGKTILKLSRRQTVDHIDTLRKHEDEMVPHPFKANTTITRRQRVQVESGMLHWTLVIQLGRKTPISCRDHLRKLEAENATSV